MSDWEALSVLSITLVFLGYLLARIGGAWANRRRLRKRFAHARDGEKLASQLMQQRGYRVLSYQPEVQTAILVDQRRWTYTLRADYLVQKGGKVFIAEVKTGKTAPRLSHAPTRRQILEYLISYRVHGVLLVDADKRRIRTITHSTPRASRAAERPPQKALWMLAWGFAIGAVVGFLTP